VKFLQKARCYKPRVAWAAADIAHLNPVCVASFMLAKLLPTTKAIRTEVDAIPYSTHRICALDSNRMCKIDQAAVTLCLHPGFVDSCRDEGVRLRNEEGVRKGGESRTRRTCCKCGPRTRYLLCMIRSLPVRDCHRGGRPNPCYRLNILSGCTVLVE
jgi:hypothetical protein